MKIVTDQPGQKRDLPGLLSFLRDCRQEAREAGTYRIASISLRVGHIDPLAVLESIFEPSELHFYLEKSGQDEALAGADEVVGVSTSGPARFREAKAFIQDQLDKTICAGDVEAEFSGPHFFCAFSFGDQPSSASAFPGVTIFLPRWQVARRGEHYTATANLRIDPDSKLESLAEKIWRAHVKFSSFDYRQPHVAPPAEVVGRPMVAPSVAADARHRFESSVAEALRLIRDTPLKKVVLARYLDVTMPAELNPLHAVNRLRMVYPNCFTYSLANGKGHSIIGASPERLLRGRGERLETEALAGSAPRGATASEDAQLAESLLKSIKDNWEHRLVIDSIQRRLAKLPITCEINPRPQLVKLANVQHLRTPITGSIPPGMHLLDVLAELHPTPAVGGSPRQEARDAIAQLEDFDRGLYAGAVGWIDGRGDGDFTVAIRSTIIHGTQARVFAGAGVVEGSVPAREWEETEVKLRAVLEVLA
jgi:menaquinone-specific isochorismate synthase